MREVTGKSVVCGLIGNPVAHTLSPAIHNTLSELLHKELVYVPFPVDNDQVGQSISGAYALHIRGLNVTVPHKSAVIPYLSGIDPLAEKIGAVNTLVYTENGYHGYNTDMPGLYRALVSDGVTVAGREIILLGAGGAARAAACLCAEYGASHVYILNRTKEKAEALAEELNRAYGKDCMVGMGLSEYQALLGKQYLVIQATSIGLSPHNEEVVIDEPEFYQMVEIGVDLIFNPAETKFMRLSKEAGARTYNGLKMLLYQGIIAYELWNDISVSEEMAAHVYERLKKEAGQ